MRREMASIERAVINNAAAVKLVMVVMRGLS
jgi:hypothetical protein